MNKILIEGFRHSAWSTETLIEVCRDLPDDDLARPAPGFGSVLATLDHLVRSDAGYVASLGGGTASWHDGGETRDLSELVARSNETASLWEQVLGSAIDGERVLALDAGMYQTHEAVVIVQALHHANIHREQVCAALTAFGREPPDLQAWAWADATGRSSRRTP